MAETDVNNAQVVTETEDANKDQVVTGSGESTEVTNQQSEKDAQTQDKTVPYDRFKEVNDQKKTAEENAAYAQRQLEIIQASQQTQQQAQQAQTTLDQAMINCGVVADDMFGEAQVRVFNEKSRLDGILMQQVQGQNANLQFINSHSDFSQVVGSVNLATGQIIAWSNEALTLLQKKPYLANASAQGIYDEVIQARRFSELESKAAVNQEHLNRTGADTASQPLGGSAAGGGASGDTSQQLMTRDEVAEIERKLANGEPV